MPIHDEVVVGSLLILADSRLDQRRVFHGRKAQGQVFAHGSQPVGIHYPLAVGGVEGRAAGVVGDFEAASLVAGNAVAEAVAVLGPNRKMAVVEVLLRRRHAEKEHILLGGTDAVSNGFGKQLAHPRAAGEHVTVAGEG